MLTPVSLHSVSQKTKLPTMITRSHLVPGKQIQALHFPELISGDVLQKDEMHLMQRRKAQVVERVCLRHVHKEGGTVSLTLFCCFTVSSPLFVIKNTSERHTHICKPHAYSIHTTLLLWNLQVQVTSKHFQLDKISPARPDCYRAAGLSDASVSVCSVNVSSVSGGSCGPEQEQQK